MDIVLSGCKDVKRGVIKHEQVEGADGKPRQVYGLAVEGYGLREVMGTFGVRACNVTSNHVMEVAQVSSLAGVGLRRVRKFALPPLSATLLLRTHRVSDSRNRSRSAGDYQRN